MKHTAVVTYRLVGSKEVEVKRFDLHSNVHRILMDKLVDNLRAHAITNELGIVIHTIPGGADYFNVGFETAE